MLWGGGRLELKAMKSLMPQSGFPGDLAFPVWASPEMLRLPEVPAEGGWGGPCLTMLQTPQHLGAHSSLPLSSLPLLWAPWAMPHQPPLPSCASALALS